MYYALTVNKDHMITGVHESAVPITANMFEKNLALANDTVLIIDSPAEFNSFMDIRCYNADGTQKPQVWCIENGYMQMPPNAEIINGELVYADKPLSEQPQTLREYLEAQAAVSTQTQRAVQITFRTLAQTDAITPEDALDNLVMFPLWQDRITNAVKVGEYLRHEDGLYRVKQTHTIQEHYPPSAATAALYTKVTLPNVIPDWVPGSWDIDVTVRHNNKAWISKVPNNTWEPGAPGVYDNIWKEVV